MEEEQKDDVFQPAPPRDFESRVSRSRGNSKTKRYLTILVLIVVLGLGIFGATRFLGGAKDSVPTITPTPTETIPAEEPTPSEEPEESQTPTKKPTNTPSPKPSVNPLDKTSGLDRSKLSIQVLNGSGASGASKKASEYLEGLGYNVVQISNAENFNFEKTTIQIKSSDEKYLNLLKSDLSKNYSIGSTSATLASSSTPDAIVTIGKE